MNCKKLLSAVFALILCCMPIFYANADAESLLVIPVTAPAGAPAVTAKGYMLLDASTGMVMLEDNADASVPIASITKVMSLLLFFEAHDAGKLEWNSMIPISKNAAGMGGSQVLLDPNVSYLASDLMKSVIVSSGNDATVALAEYIAGSEAAFVEAMNQKAKNMGLAQTVFANATGLPAPGHHSSAHDVALMSLALLKYSELHQWSTIWIDTLVHPSGRETMLSNTNRLIRFYEGADGLKTGSTSEAGYCLSATAKRGDTRLVAVILGAPDSQTRFNQAQALLDYGFANWETVIPIADKVWKNTVAVKGGNLEELQLKPVPVEPLFLPKGSKVVLEAEVPEVVNAPVTAGEKIGEVAIMLDGEEIGRSDLLAVQDIPATGLMYLMKRVFGYWMR